MGISVAGIGSNLDVNSIVTQLMAIETQPKTVIQQKQSAFNSQISAYSQLKSSLSSLQSAAEALKNSTSFNIYKTSVLNNSTSAADASVIVATDASAAKGSYKIDVTQLAQNQKLLTATGVADKSTTTFGGSDTVIKIKSAGYTSGTTVAGEISVALTGAVTLEGLRDAINNASDNAGKVTASILDTGTAGANRYRLTLTSNTTGSASQITEFGVDGGTQDTALEALIGKTTTNSTAGGAGSTLVNTSGTTTGSMTVTQAAQDASILIDNTVTVNSSTNTFTNTIQGLTLTATKVTSGTAGTAGSGVNVNVDRDLDAVKSKINTFVSSYNNVRSTINNLRNGALYNDLTTLGSVERRLSNALGMTIDNSSSGTNGTMKYLAQIGITQQKDGTLSTAATAGITTNSFDSNMNSNLDEVIKFFVGNSSTDGFATKVASEFKALGGYDGLVDKRTTTLKSQVKDAQSQIDAMTLRLTAKEKALRAQFTALDTAMGKMQQTMSYVSSQLGTA